MYLTEHTELTEKDVGFIFFRFLKKIKSTLYSSCPLSVHSVASVRNAFSSSLPRVARGFTLVELLVVISIIAILMGIILPMFFSAKERAREAKARAEVKALETAFKAYLDTYKVWPNGFVDGEIKDNIFKTLCGENVGAAPGMNPQKVAFYEFSSTNTAAAYDPWSNPSDASMMKAYRVLFDKNYDNKIDAQPDVFRPVVVYSPGKDRQDNSGGGDDVASWK